MAPTECARKPSPLRDAVNNVLEIVEHAEHCLIYDRPLTAAGLTWGELVVWWSQHPDFSDDDVARHLYRRLRASLSSGLEQLLFDAYGARYGGEDAASLPALIPQVYLHYDPYTHRELGQQGA